MSVRASLKLLPTERRLVLAEAAMARVALGAARVEDAAEALAVVRVATLTATPAGSTREEAETAEVDVVGMVGKAKVGCWGLGRLSFVYISVVLIKFELA